MADQKTCFKKVDYDLSDLLHYVDLGDIGLPDIQRPFVWSNAKVRDLFDSMYKGFPVTLRPEVEVGPGGLEDGFVMVSGLGPSRSASGVATLRWRLAGRAG